MMQTIQRPAIESIKGIQYKGAPAPAPPAGSPVMTAAAPTPGPPGRGPPRGLMGDFDAAAEGKGPRGPPPSGPPGIGAARKPGAISMFEETPIKTPEPAEKKIVDAVPLSIQTGSPLPSGAPRPGPPPPRGTPTSSSPVADPSSGAMLRAPRPLPPKINPPGIPEGQPLPPETRPPKEGKPPPPTKIAPDRGRAPPREDPDANKNKFEQPPAPVDSEPPYKRGKKVKVVEKVYVKRRERDFPEFEESSDEEDEMDAVTKEPKRQFIKQPARPELVDVNKLGSVIEAKLAADREDDIVVAKPAVTAASAPAPAPAAAQAQAQSASLPSKPKSPVPSTPSTPPPKSATPPPKTATPPPKTATPPSAAATALANKELIEKELEAPSAQALQKAAEAEALREEAKEAATALGLELPVVGEDEEEGEFQQVVDQPTGMPPNMALMETKSSAFVPPPPTDFAPYIDNSMLGKTLTRGRLLIRCKQGYEIRRKGDTNKIPRTDPYIRFKLGIAERHPWKWTKYKRKQNAFPNFEDEVVSFNITEPDQFVFNDDLVIVIECMNKSTLNDESLGSVTMSVVRFLKSPFRAFEEKIPIYYPGQMTTQSKLLLEFMFEEARTGIVQLTFFEARGLRNVDPMGQQNPYVEASIGDYYKKRCKTVEKGGTSPYFAEEELLMWIDQQNWVNDLKISILDEALGEDKPIGLTHFCALPYMNIRPDEAKVDNYDLFYTILTDPKDDRSVKEIAQGEIVMRVRFLPAGKLTVHIDKVKGLRFPENYAGSVDRLDPYVNMTIEGKAVKTVKRTPADKDGGADPTFDYEVYFEITDQYVMDLEVFHQTTTGNDVLLGSIQISLLTVFRNGDTSQWWNMKQRKANGGVREGGDIFVHLKFHGQSGIAYPQLRPDVDSFDDTIRAPPSKPKIESLDDEVIVKEPVSTIPQEEKEEELPPGIPLPDEDKNKPQPPEFTDDEICAAFKFIDLDHNNYVGAGEIRHILVCMGEMITDEEIDTMISMVDLDGDGQVSYTEFRALVLHPNPGLADMHAAIALKREDERQEDKNMLTGKVKGTDLSAFQRQKEMLQREAKKEALCMLIYDSEINFEYVKRSYENFTNLKKEKRIGGRIRFEEFCSCLEIEPIVQYKNLHALFDSEELGDLDFREFLLSMLNFIPVDREMRIRFSFKMMDEMNTGYIARKEVEEILRGNHMISLASVQRKADTIMRQAGGAKGTINENEFVVVSKKFPNILVS